MLLSVLAQGTLVPFVAHRLAVPMRVRPLLPWQLSVPLAHEPRSAVDFVVAAGSRADGRTIGEISERRASSWVSLVVRDGHVVQPSDEMRLRVGDHVHVLTEGSTQPRQSELFGERDPTRPG